MGRWIAAAGMVALVGWINRGCLDIGAFACDGDEDCDVADGKCVDGYCAIPDPDCPDEYRFVDWAPASLAGRCTELPADTDGTTTTSGTTVSLTEAPTQSTSSTAEDVTSDDASTTTGESSPPESTGQACVDDRCACARDVAVGSQHTCAIRLDGSVVCWGQNAFGQLGDVSADEPWPVPIDLGGLDATKVSAYYHHSCAVAGGDGSVWCWGDNEFGSSAPMVPRPIVGPTSGTDVVDPVHIQLGVDHTCTTNGVDSLTCWGGNNFYQLAATDGEPGPVTSSLDVAPIGLTSGHRHGCVWTDAEVFCWGRNDLGQLGSAAPDPVATPTVVEGLPQTTVVSVAAGIDHTCAAVEGGGEVWCWGLSDVGQLGVVLPAPDPWTATPTLVWDVPGATVVELLARGETTCAWLDTGDLYCWGGLLGETLGTEAVDGDPLLPPRRVIVPDAEFGNETIELIGLGSSHICVVTDAMSLWCWGRDNSHQLGGVAPGQGHSAVEVDLDCP